MVANPDNYKVMFAAAMHLTVGCHREKVRGKKDKKKTQRSSIVAQSFPNYTHIYTDSHVHV